MSILSRVYGIERDGTVSTRENDKKGHNAISIELYEGFVNTLTSQQKEISKGAVRSHWPVAGAVVKNRKDLIFLELLGDDIDIPFCVTLVPTILSKRQLLAAKERYEAMDDMHFMDVTNCNGNEFITHIDFKPFADMYEYLDGISKVKDKIEVEMDLD